MTADGDAPVPWKAILARVLLALVARLVLLPRMAEATFFFFVAGALAAGLRALETGETLVALGAGALAGLAYLTRPEGLAVPLALGAVLVFAAVQRLRGAPGERGTSGTAGGRPI